MSLEDIMETYPVKDTYIGWYNEDGTVTIPDAAATESIEKSEYSPFWTDGSILPFLEYEGDHTFRCWSFIFFPVLGYMTKDGKDYQFVTYTEDFGFEVYELNGNEVKTGAYDQVLAPDPEEYGWYWGGDWMNQNAPFRYLSFEHRVEQAAKRFDLEKYMAGEIITTPEQLKKFLEEVENK